LIRDRCDHSSVPRSAHPRGAPGSKPEPAADWHSGAGLPPVRSRYAINVIQDSEERLLLLRRSLAASLGPGQWGLCGGHIEPGEAPRACSEREMREELGAGHRTELLARLDPVRDTHYGGVMEVHLFHYRWLEGEVELNEEHTDFAWVRLSELASYAVMKGVLEDLSYFGIRFQDPACSRG
jgi:8-oxo-dGTP diphosphatase